MDFTLQELLAQNALIGKLFKEGKSINYVQHKVYELRILQSKLKSGHWNNDELLAAFNETL